MATICDFAMAGIVAVSVFLGWKHADEPFFDTTRPRMPRRLKVRAFLLGIAGAVIMLLVLLEPAASTARETFNSLSTVGFKIFWLILMGTLVISYGFGQLVLYDMVANYRTKYRSTREGRGDKNGRKA